MKVVVVGCSKEAGLVPLASRLLGHVYDILDRNSDTVSPYTNALATPPSLVHR